jgi:ferric-dicitrate binding protein FerR (iron transport regulator)
MSLPVTESPDMRERHDEPVTADEKRRRRLRARSIAIALALAAFVVLFYLVTIAKLGSNILSRPV